MASDPNQLNNKIRLRGLSRIPYVRAVSLQVYTRQDTYELSKV